VEGAGESDEGVLDGVVDKVVAVERYLPALPTVGKAERLVLKGDTERLLPVGGEPGGKLQSRSRIAGCSELVGADYRAR
jgi:hypothetical protein